MRTVGAYTYPDPAPLVDPDVVLDPEGPGAGLPTPPRSASPRGLFMRRTLGSLVVWLNPATAVDPMHKEPATLHVKSTDQVLTIAQRRDILSLFAEYHRARLERVDELARHTHGFGWAHMGAQIQAAEASIDIDPKDVNALVTKLSKIGVT